MPGDGFTIKSRIRNLLRSQSIKSKKKRKENIEAKLTLEKVLGITASGNSGVACDPKSGLVAYPAGCVIVLLDPKTNSQHHIINTTRKTITALAFSPDGRYLVTGESGHLPAVRLWDVAERQHVAQLQEHKYGISCVAFSPNNKYIVSVGNQHDMMVNVWAWKMDVVVAANKVSSKVTGVSFAEDRSYFVTVGNRHIKFWYLDQCKASKTSTAVPLLGRVGLLGELRNNFFCDVACGRGASSDSTFCITTSGLLCEFNKNRMLDKWVDLQTTAAQSISLSEDVIFCGCSDGTVRAFDSDLRFLGTLPRPHALGCDVSAVTEASHIFKPRTDCHYPDVIAVAYDCTHRWISCVYSDHSLYVWDVRDIHRVGKVNSALFHSASVWDLQMFPDVRGETPACLPPGAFLTCSADSTIRLWCPEERTHAQHQPRNILSKDLLNVIYTDGNTACLLDSECAADKTSPAETRTGIRTISISPDGKHLASGDRGGILRVHDLGSKEEIMKVEAHDAEILCLEYSKPETGLKLLATASRDRLIHVLDASRDYSLLQTLDVHSSSITAIRFAANENKVSMISCGADKSIYFHTAHKTDRGAEFRRSHHMVRKTTLYDMAVDATCKYAAVGCQDRCIRIFNISSGKQKKVYKGSVSEDGSLLRVEIDPSGQYVATSCSDKNISIFDFYSGECVATVFGHSEIVTGLKFTNDCKYLITVSGDSCVFVWRLPPELTVSMQERLHHLQLNPNAPPYRSTALRREAHSAPVLGGLSSDLVEESREEEAGDTTEHEGNTSCSSSVSSLEEEDMGGSDDGQTWEIRRHKTASQVIPDTPRRPRRRWSYRMGSLELMVKSMLDLRQLETFGQKKNPNYPPLDKERPVPSSLHSSMEQVEEKSRRRWPWLSPPRGGAVLFPEENESEIALPHGHYAVREQRCNSEEGDALGENQDSCSPDSGCSFGYDWRESIPDCDREEGDSLDHGSSDEEEESGFAHRKVAVVTSMDEALRRVTADHIEQDFLKQNYETLAESCISVEQGSVQRISMSSQFLSKGHNDRDLRSVSRRNRDEQGSVTPKLLTPKAQTLMEKEETKIPECRLSVCASEPEGMMTADSSAKLRPPRKSFESQVWMNSNPIPKMLLTVDTSLHKSHSAQNLSTEPLCSPAPSGVQRELRRRPQQLWLSTENLKPPLVPSPSSSSPHSSESSQPWDSPKLKSLHSYMNPTISSLAKSNRSFSLGDELQSVSPPHSPLFYKSRRRSSTDEAEVEPPLFSSSPVAPWPPSLSSMPSLLVSPFRMASTASLNVPPSRIPLLKQPISPRHSQVQKMKSSSSWCGNVGDTPPFSEKIQVCSRQLSSGPEAETPNPLPHGQKRKSLSESWKMGGHTIAGKQHLLVVEDDHMTSLPADFSVSLETCQRAAADLHSSLDQTITLFSLLSREKQNLSPDQQDMRKLLSQVLSTVKAELDALPHLTSLDQQS